MQPTTTSDVDGVTMLVMQVRAGQPPPPKMRRRVREEAGVSIRAAARAIGVAPMSFLRWGQGRSRPRAKHAEAYRRFLDALEELGA